MTGTLIVLGWPNFFKLKQKSIGILIIPYFLQTRLEQKMITDRYTKGKVQKQNNGKFH